MNWDELMSLSSQQGAHSAMEVQSVVEFSLCDVAINNEAASLRQEFNQRGAGAYKTRKAEAK